MVTTCIDGETCTTCGLCAAGCPMSIPHPVPGQAGQVRVDLRVDRLSMCIRCGHCMAICPTQSIHMDGLCYAEQFFELPHSDLQSEQFFDLLAGRRSVRVFKDTPVPREMLEKIVEAVSLAPMGFPPHKVQVTVVQRREVIERLPELREVFEIPPQNQVLASMIVGYPRYRFKRGIRRKLANVNWI